MKYILSEDASKVKRPDLLDKITVSFLAIAWLFMITVIIFLPLWTVGKAAILLMYFVFAYITLSDTNRRMK